MGKLQRILAIISANKNAPYEDQSPKETPITTADLLRFMEKQQEQNSLLMTAMLQTSQLNAETMKNYIDLFKPREVKSTTLEEREMAKENLIKPRESEWEGIGSLQEFNAFTSNGIPKDLE